MITEEKSLDSIIPAGKRPTKSTIELVSKASKLGVDPRITMSALTNAIRLLGEKNKVGPFGPAKGAFRNLEDIITRKSASSSSSSLKK